MSIRNAIIFFICLTVVFVSAVTATVIILTKKDAAKLSDPSPCDFLTEGDWFKPDSITEENLIIRFHKNGEYAFFCECGEPVGNSDVYDHYSYDKEKNIIYLSGPESDIREIKVVYYDDHFLILNFKEEGTLIFRNKNNLADETLLGDAEKHINKPEMAFVTLLGFEDGLLTVAPFNYDRDSHKLFADNIFKIKASDSLKCKSVSVTVDNGVSDTEIKKLEESDHQFIGEYYSGGYIKFDSKNEISEIVFYGSLEIYG